MGKLAVASGGFPVFPALDLPPNRPSDQIYQQEKREIGGANQERLLSWIWKETQTVYARATVYLSADADL